MNQIELVKRAWRITWRYRALWIFGILLALTSGGGSGWGGGGRSSSGGGGGLPPIPALSHIHPGEIAGIIALCCCALLVVFVTSLIVRYVAKAALYRCVDQIEETGVAPTWREGFRLGWTNRTFRLFLLDLIVGIMAVVAILILAIAAASPLLLLIIKSSMAKAVGIGLTVWLGLIWLLIVIVTITGLGLLGQFWSREIILSNRSIGEALTSGYQLVREHLKDVGIMWLLMLAIGFGVGLVMIPAVIAVLLGAGAAGAALGFAIYAVTNSVIWAVAGGVPLFLLIMVIPVSIIRGIYLVFESSTWTLTYREVVSEEAG